MEKVKLTGLWKKKTKSGGTYLSGKIGLAKVLVFQNDFKEKDNDPDYNLFVVNPDKNGDETSADENL